jgi:hypothetical protein
LQHRGRVLAAAVADNPRDVVGEVELDDLRQEVVEPQAIEGGGGYLRLLPGVKIVEQLTDAN